MSNIDYDDFTEAERAKVDVERLAHDLRFTANRLSGMRTDERYAPFFAGEPSADIWNAYTCLMLICSEERIASERKSNTPKLVSVR